MPPTPQPSGRFLARTALALATLGAFALGGWLAEGLAVPDRGRRAERQAPGPGKRPRVKEEEEAPPTKRKVIRIGESGSKPKPPPAKPAVPAEGSLREAARLAEHFAVKQVFEELSVPYDLVTFNKSTAVSVGGAKDKVQRLRVEPLPTYVADHRERLPNTVKLVPLDAEGKPGMPQEFSRTRFKSVQPYELIARDAVREFLDKRYASVLTSDPKYLSRSDQLLAAEKVLAAVVRFHESARSRGVRKGEGWAPVEDALRKQLFVVLLERLGQLKEARDWSGALALAQRITSAYPDSRNEATKPLAELITAALQDGTATADQLRLVRERLRLLDEQFPDSEAIKAVIKDQVDSAQRLYNQARELAGDRKTLPEALEKLRQAEEIWPYLPGLRAYRTELTHAHPVLRVGMRELPRFMSPALASNDAELRAVELLFESLVKVSPGTGVARYQPGLAIGRPRIIPLGRRFHLPRNASWSDGRILNGADVRATVRLMTRDAPRTSPLARRAALLEGATLRGDPFRVDVSLNQGYLDPLALMTFKVLPQWYKIRNEEEFAEKPIGSGPYIFGGVHSEAGRAYARFLANPNYSSRPSKFGLPRVREIRFFAVGDPIKEFTLGNLDLALDLTAEQAGKLRARDDLTVLQPGTSTPNRRVYFLAVNNTKGALGRVELRRALALAINRELLLRDHFRAGQKVHKALNGPYPAGCWACNPKLKNRADPSSLDPCDPARAKLEAERFKDVGKITLKYPSGDPVVFAALSALRDQVHKTIGVNLQLVERDPRELRKDVEGTRSYELAYYHYDFPDETYRLEPLLGPDNYLNFDGETVSKLMQEIRERRHFQTVRAYTHTLHSQLLADMPLIPLWQLDLFSAVRADLDTVPFDPILVFTDVDQWRFKKKDR